MVVICAKAKHTLYIVKLQRECESVEHVLEYLHGCTLYAHIVLKV